MLFLRFYGISITATGPSELDIILALAWGLVLMAHYWQHLKFGLVPHREDTCYILLLSDSCTQSGLRSITP